MRCPRCDTQVNEDDENGCPFCGESIYSLLLGRVKEEIDMEPRRFADYEEEEDQ